MTLSESAADVALFRVLINAEEQYSIWPASVPVPPGWEATGHSGAKDDCMAYIDENWTDMRPLSLREAMAETRPDNS